MRALILDDLLSLVSGRDGIFLVNRKDVYVGRAIEIYGEYSGLESAFLKGLVSAGDNVVEVGANIGAHTVGLAKAVGTQGRVDAFEPQRACYALLQAQIALNQLHNVYAHRQAVGRAAGRLWVPAINYTEFGNFAGTVLSSNRTATSEPVDVVTLDERMGDHPCSLLKVDVEGMEEDVIRGAAKLIAKRHPLIYVENDRVENSRALVARLLGLGYRLWWHIPFYYNPDNFFGIKDNAYPAQASFNMFCCRENHPAAAGLVEIKSPDDPHPLIPKPLRMGLPYTIKT